MLSSVGNARIKRGAKRTEGFHRRRVGGVRTLSHGGGRGWGCGEIRVLLAGCVGLLRPQNIEQPPLEASDKKFYCR